MSDADLTTIYFSDFFFTHEERERVIGILKALKIDKSPDVILIDARDDNKPSASKADGGEND